MHPVKDTPPNQILTDTDGPAAEVINASGRAPICLVCEHASHVIPPSLGDLGLSHTDRTSHAAWDPGAADLARALSALLDAPLVLGRFSRLVYDCNRPPERPDAITGKSETITVPGNQNLTPAERNARTTEIHDAFHAVLAATLDGFTKPPALVTVHSFTPTWFGTARKTEIGLLHDREDRMAAAMLAVSGPDYLTELNEPYSAVDGVTYLLERHATARALDHVMIEVRNDLLTTPNAISTMAATLHAMIAAAMAALQAAT